MTDDIRRDPTFVSKYGPWVLVSGASEGTGA
ncbi:MAG: short-chain dehydrogenase/reductase, partial [Brevundimonas sp.]|nr:short-chain dehydrogenase/reductase [Brevundimonas sp.]